MGPWGEASKDLHSLVKVLGESRVAATARKRGRPASDKELGVVVSQVPGGILFLRIKVAKLPENGSNF